jgi:DNA invertase Pin-like site-specific DNA recombinase
MSTATRRAIGVVRVSQVNGRDGDSFASPGEQRDRIRAACERDGLQLLEVVEELDVSGGKSLDERPGLGPAVEAIEDGRADVIAAAYFDRLFRSLTVQAEVVERVERAGGQVLAVDVGRVTNGSAGQWLSGTMIGAVSEYQRRTAKERSGEAQARAVARGVLPYPNVPPGYVRGDDGRLVPDPATASIVADAFRMRADGATIADVRAFLAANDIVRSYHGAGSMLTSRVYLGEIHFGKLTNLSAHPAIVDADTFRRVQRVRVSRGRKPKSERLLARLGVLRCASCGARMVVGSANNRQYALYRCPPTGDCTRRVTISADLVEGIVVDRVRAALADVEGRASIEDNAREAESSLEGAQAELDALIDMLDPLEPAARRRLDAATAKRDGAQDRVDHLSGHRAVVMINAARDWDRLSLDARRALIRATVDRVLIAPGRGADRVVVELVSE